MDPGSGGLGPRGSHIRHRESARRGAATYSAVHNTRRRFACPGVSHDVDFEEDWGKSISTSHTDVTSCIAVVMDSPPGLSSKSTSCDTPGHAIVGRVFHVESTLLPRPPTVHDAGCDLPRDRGPPLLGHRHGPTLQDTVMNMAPTAASNAGRRPRPLPWPSHRGPRRHLPATDCALPEVQLREPESRRSSP